jgi:RHS repeat-associated protein
LYDGGIRSRCTSKERDSETGLDDFGARHYSSGLGRFLTPDWSEEPDPVPFANPGSPQSLNLYRYASNNPVSFVDPDGHDCVVQTRTSDKTESVSVSGSTCNGVKVGDGQSATYVPGTVTGIQAGQDGKSITIGYTPYEGGGYGVQSANAAPYPDRPRLAYGFNAAGYAQLGLASRVTDKYIATPLLTFLLFAVPGALEAAGPSASLGLGSAVVAGVGKAAAKQAVEDLAISQAQKAALKREIARATTKEAVSVERLADGSYRVLRTRPGADGYQVFSKVVDSAGNTRSAQTAVNGAGDIVHYDPKN